MRFGQQEPYHRSHCEPDDRQRHRRTQLERGRDCACDQRSGHGEAPAKAEHGERQGRWRKFEIGKYRHSAERKAYPQGFSLVPVAEPAPEETAYQRSDEFRRHDVSDHFGRKTAFVFQEGSWQSRR